MKNVKKFSPVFCILITLFGIFFFKTEIANAQVTIGSVSSSTGGTGRAAVSPGDSVILNPAMLYHLRGYIFYSSYRPGESLFALSDNTKETVIPTAFTLSKKENFQNFRLTLADHVYKGISMGLSAHYSEHSENNIHAHQWNSDLGFSYLPTKQIGLGLVFYNLQGESKDLPAEDRLQRQVGLGGTYLYRNFLRWRLDVLSGPENSMSKPTAMVGMESLLNKWMLLRLGYQENSSTEQKYATAGLGLDYPRFSLNYGFEAELEKSQNKRHSVDLAIPF